MARHGEDCPRAVRHAHDSRRLGLAGHHEGLCHAHLRRVRLDDVEGVLIYEQVELLGRGQALTRRDVKRRGRGELGEAVHVQWVQRLFEEVHPIRLELAGGGDGIAGSPVRIEVRGTAKIDAEPDVGSQRLTRRRKLGHSLIVEVVTPAVLDRLESLLAQRGALTGDLLGRLAPQLPLPLRLVAPSCSAA